MSTNPRADKAAHRLEMARALEVQFLHEGSEMKGIGHMIVVAGASGAGKSTFVSEMAEGNLSAAVMSELPEGVGNWIQLRAGAYDSWLPELLERAQRDQISGAILDYDMVGRGILDGCGYADDPVLHLMRISTAITVVNIRPPVGKLVSQLVERENRSIENLTNAGAHGVGARLLTRMRRTVSGLMPAGWPARIRKVAAHILPPALLWATQGRSPEDRLERLGRKIARYNREGWLDAIYAQWESYLRELARNGASIQQIFIEPDSDNGGSLGWRLAADRRRVRAPRPSGAAS